MEAAGSWWPSCPTTVSANTAPSGAGVTRFTSGIWNSPEVITGRGQQDAMGLDVSALHHQHNVEEDAAVTESQQPPEQGLGVLRAAVGVADAVWVRGLRRQLAQLAELLLLRHPDHRTKPQHLSRQLARQRGRAMRRGGNTTPRTTGELCSQRYLLLTQLLLLPPANLCVPWGLKRPNSLSSPTACPNLGPSF